MLYNNAGTWTAFSELYWDDTNHRLGIDVDTSNGPSEKLSVDGEQGGEGIGLYYDTVSWPAIRGSIRHGGDASGYNNEGGLQIVAQGANVSTGGSGNIKFFTPTGNSVDNATDAPLAVRMTILQNGNVGIGDTTPASLLTVGNGDLFQVSSSGAITAAVGITSAGGAVSLNANSDFATNINTGTSTGAVAIGGGSGTFTVNSTAFDVSTAGALSGITTIDMSGQLTSTLATGTSPFVVASTTLVTNLNADLLDGAQPSMVAGNSTIVQRNASGYVLANYFNTTADETTNVATHFAVETSSDGYIRWQTPAYARTSLGLDAGGTGDIWVEKAGDTMTGNLHIIKPAGDNTIVMNMQAGGVAQPWQFIFPSATNGGSYGAGANNFGIYNTSAARYLMIMKTDGSVTFGSGLTTLGGNLTVTGTAWTATPTISGLITATSGLTASGVLTANSTLDANGAVTLGDGGDDIAIDSNDWDITSAGAASGLTTINASSNITSGDKSIASRYGFAGTYNSVEVQGIWSIGDAYEIDIVNDDFGSLYGMGYAYNQNGGSPFASEHQIVFTSNGSIGAAITLTGDAYFAGNVGINDTTPEARLKVVSAAGTDGGSNNYAVYGAATTSASNLYGGYFTASGGAAASYNAGVYGGSTSTGTGTSNRGVMGAASGAATYNYGVYGSASGGTSNYAFYSDTGYNMFGNRTAVGSTSTAFTRALNVGGAISVQATTPGTEDFYISYSGGLAYINTGLHIEAPLTSDFDSAYGNTVCRSAAANGILGTCSSDARIKGNINYDIISSSDALSGIMQIQPATFQLKKVVEGGIYTDELDAQIHVGFIAQDVQKVFPVAVYDPGDGGMLQFDYTSLIPFVVKAIQEQQSEIALLQNSLQKGSLNVNGATIQGYANIGALNVSGPTTLASLHVTTDAQFDGNVAVTGNLSVANLTVNGHIITAGGTPVAIAGSAAGTDAITTVLGTDTTGTITVITGTHVDQGRLIEITFAKAFSKNPKIILTPGNAETTSLKFYRDSYTDKFYIQLVQPPVEGTTYTFDYMAME
jgi:hypothetical protein